MRREAGRLSGVACAGALVVAMAAAGNARAQPAMGGVGPPPGTAMPDLRVMNGKPLPDRGLAAGTVTVRVARKMPVNAVAGAEVTALVKNPGGDVKKRTARTDDRGRAIFDGVGAGNQFQAEVVVDGETIKSSAFTVPSEGGVRTMLIAGLGPAPPGGGSGAGAGEDQAEGGGQDEGFRLGATTGSATPAPELPKGTLELRAFDQKGKPLPQEQVQLGAAAQGSEGNLKISKATTNAEGLARFEGLATGPTVGYAAVIDHGGMRLGTPPFAMPDQGGVRAEIRALERTADPSVIAFGSGGRIILQMHDEILQVMEILPIENRSEKLFDPGPGGIEVPLPKGFVNAEGGTEGSHKLEVRKNYGIAVHGPVAPHSTTNNEITFAFTVPYHGSSHELAQPLPNGLGTTTLIMEQIGDLAVTGAGIGARQSREVSGRKYWVIPVEAQAAGSTLTFTVTGLPSSDDTGRIVAGALALLLVLASIYFSRRPEQVRKVASDTREKLLQRREALFEQLVGVENERRALNAEHDRHAHGRSGEGASDVKDRRSQIVGKLETIYRDLAALDQSRAP
jgi:hypothetical protein